jgi:Transposase, Mutator family
VRRAKDKRQVPTRYYRPEQTTCLHCGHVLRRGYQLWQKHIVFLHGREWIVNMAYRCPNPRCAAPERVYASQEARSLTVRGSSFALEVIVQIGYWRFWYRWTVRQIHAVLTQDRCLPISEREVLYLIGEFLVLFRCTYHLRLAAHAAAFRRQGLFVAIDALKPEKGNTALYVVRELKFGLVLHEAALLTADHRTLAARLLQPVKALGYRLRGIVSEDEKALVLAVAQSFPGVPHQTCQIHCLREAATPIANADRAFKKALKHAIRGPLYAACRALQEQLSLDDRRGEVLRTYADLIRSTLTEASKPPFALGGLHVFEDLQRLAASLRRSRQKGGIRSWSSCWPWLSAAKDLPHAINTSNTNGTGWWNWTDVSIPQTWKGGRARPARRSGAKSKSFWPSWNNTRTTVPKMPGWSPISVRAFATAGRASSSAMPGRNATAPTMTWKPSLVGCAPDNGKLRAANPSMSLSSATGPGPSSLIRLNPTSKSYSAVGSLTKPSLIKSTHAFVKRSNNSKCFIAFATGLAIVSKSWNSNGPKLLALNPNNCLVC